MEDANDTCERKNEKTKSAKDISIRYLIETRPCNCGLYYYQKSISYKIVKNRLTLFPVNNKEKVH